MVRFCYCYVLVEILTVPQLQCLNHKQEKVFSLAPRWQKVYDQYRLLGGGDDPLQEASNDLGGRFDPALLDLPVLP